MFAPKVSVLMANYNGERFLASAIVSVLEQSYRDFEFIVVDDGSTDSSSAILRSFVSQDSRVKGFYFCHNRGFACALNYGLAQARGEYIARMDSDDLCHPNRLAKQIAYLEKYPKIFVLGCRTVNIDEQDKKIGKLGGKVPFRCGRLLIARRMVLGEYFIHHPTLMVRKFCFEELRGYRECFPIGEDLDLYTRLLERYGAIFENLSERLYCYRRYKESLTGTHSIDIHVKIQILILYSAFCRRKGMDDPLAKIKKLNFRNLPLSNNIKKYLTDVIFLMSFYPIFHEDNKISHLSSIMRAEKLLSNLPCILKNLPSPIFYYIKHSLPFIRLARAWLAHGYWFRGMKYIALAFITNPFASLDFFFKRSIFHGSSFVRKLFRAHS